MKILSLFDGISCARVALERAGIPVDVYYASEVDKYAMQISQKNWPDIVQLGDVKTVSDRFDINSEFGNGIDLLIGGSPCQDLSIAKKNRKGLDGERSGLFWEYVRILNEVKPRFFILENVASMPKSAQEEISKTLGVQPVMINASLLSAQNRKRLFWVGRRLDIYDQDNRFCEYEYEQVEIPQPEDRGILLKDILLDGTTENLKSLCITSTYYKRNDRDFLKKASGQMIQVGDIGDKNVQSQRVYSPDGKSVALQAGGGGMGAKTGLYLVVPEATKKGFAVAHEGDSVDISFPTSKTRRGRVGNKVKNLMTQSSIGVFTNGELRKLHPVECERLQGLPDGYTEGVSNTQRYKTLGNAFNVDVVCHILKFIR